MVSDLRLSSVSKGRLLSCSAAAWAMLCLWAQLVSALPGPADAEAQSRFIIIVLTVLTAILLGLLLYYFSQQSSKTRFKDGSEARAAAQRRAAAVPDPKALMPVILQELNQLPGSHKQRQDVAQTVYAIVSETIDEQVSHVRQEVDEQYKKVLEEKRREEVVLRRKYQTTLHEKKQTSAVLESIAEGLVVVNNKGEVVMMNPAATRLLAVNPQEGVGKPLLDNVQDKQLVSLVRGTTDEDQEIVLSAKQESTKRVLRASNAMITDENGNTVGMVSVLSDVTKQREVDQMKSEFVSKVSHELRTPIVAMQHALSIMSDQVAGPLTEEQQKFVSLTQRNLERLNRLINDLLDLSKLEANRMELHLQPCAIGPLVNGVCESLDPWAKTKAITLIKRVTDGLPEAALDQARIIQVLTNLVGNAIKFTPRQGRITVEAKLGNNGDGLEVSVADTGVGIADADLPKLFGKFQQVGERSASDISGTGLGLAISKEIVELHKGRIWAESKVQEGTRFVFTLPFKPQPTEVA